MCYIYKSLIEGCEAITFETRHKELPGELEEDDRYKRLGGEGKNGHGKGERICVVVVVVVVGRGGRTKKEGKMAREERGNKGKW
jgi:hypothetical protein